MLGIKAHQILEPDFGSASQEMEGDGGKLVLRRCVVWYLQQGMTVCRSSSTLGIKAPLFVHPFSSRHHPVVLAIQTDLFKSPLIKLLYSFLIVSA